MPHPPQDSGSARVLRTQYRQLESRAARLRLLVETGQELTRLAPAAMGRHVLQRACAFLAMDHGLLLEWPAGACALPSASHGDIRRTEALIRLARPGRLTIKWFNDPAPEIPNALYLPLLGADGVPFAALLLANTVRISAPESEDLQSLQLLATLLSAHLENSRLLDALSARERDMSELVHRLFTAQEDERKRVAYELHDGLAQNLAGLHQRLQGFAGRCPALPDPLGQELDTILQLAQRCVGEGRQVITGLRPSVLDDFGLLNAIDKEADRLREAGHVVQWSLRHGERLPADVEIALFRIAQEAINNILKHAGSGTVQLSLEHRDEQISLTVEDQGRGFELQHRLDPATPRGIGLTAMHERAALLGGRFACQSTPGTGTRLLATVPLFNHGADA